MLTIHRVHHHTFIELCRRIRKHVGLGLNTAQRGRTLVGLTQVALTSLHMRFVSSKTQVGMSGYENRTPLEDTPGCEKLEGGTAVSSTGFRPRSCFHKEYYAIALKGARQLALTLAYLTSRDGSPKAYRTKRLADFLKNQSYCFTRLLGRINANVCVSSHYLHYLRLNDFRAKSAPTRVSKQQWSSSSVTENRRVPKEQAIQVN